jgi:membrane-associated phospholipid phosphatase
VNAALELFRDRRWQIALLIVAIAAFASYHLFDIAVAEFFRGYRKTAFYDIFKRLTHLGDGEWYIIPPLLLWLFWRKRNTLYARAALLIFATASASGIIANLLKVFFGRFRPTLYFKEQLYGFDWFHLDAAMRSFPSGHSTTVMSAWLAFALLFPKYRIALLAVGVFLALTRVFVTAHYVSDILAGGFLGATITLVCYRLIYTPTKESL